MPHQFDTDHFTAIDMRIALNEIFPESTDGAIPVTDQCDAVNCLATRVARRGRGRRLKF